MPRPLLLLLAMTLGGLLLGLGLRKPANPPPAKGVVLPGGAVVAWSPGYRVSFFGVERLHPFDIGKYDRIAGALVDGGHVPEGGFAIPAPVTREQLEGVHDPAYLDSLTDPAALSRALEVSLPSFLPAASLDARVLAPFRRSSGGTLVAGRAALSHGLGINLGGGYHHARPDMGHGFCVFNDVALTIRELRGEGLLEGPVLIVDTDAHQGDGNHAFFADDDSVFSISFHQGDIFPTPKLRGDRDVSLRGGDGDEALLNKLERTLGSLLEAEPWALVIHVAGADVLSDDPLAGLNLTPEGLAARDLLVLEMARAQGVPVLHVLAGGYGPSAAEAQAASVGGMLAAIAARAAAQGE